MERKGIPGWFVQKRRKLRTMKIALVRTQLILQKKEGKGVQPGLERE